MELGNVFKRIANIASNESSDDAQLEQIECIIKHYKLYKKEEERQRNKTSIDWIHYRLFIVIIIQLAIIMASILCK